MRILITGGAGFIGSNLADELLKLGHSICVIDNLSTGVASNLTPNPNLLFLERNIEVELSVDDAFSYFQPDMVVHAAASYKDPNDWEQDAFTNVIGTINVLRACKKYEVKKIVYFQTSLCYGLSPKQSPIKISCPIDPNGSSYAISKTTAEHYIELSGIPYLSFRLANIYGKRNLTGAIPTFFHRITNKQKCIIADSRRDFVYIDDMIQLVIKGILSDKTGKYHISTGMDYSIRQVYDNILFALQAQNESEEKPRNNDDAGSILLDPSKTLKEFGWSATTPLEEGIKRAVIWYKHNPVTQTYTHLKNLK